MNALFSDMKTYKLYLLLIVAAATIGKANAQESTAKHSVYLAPFAGVNFTRKAPLYGGEIGYEFRLNKKWGFTAAANVGYTQKDDPAIYDAGNGATRALNSKLFNYSFSGGAKYYINRFYLSADLGYQEAFNTINYKYTGTGSSYNYGTTAKVGFYQAYGIGYQIPLKKGDNIEIFTKYVQANGNKNLITGFRYNFGLSRR